MTKLTFKSLVAIVIKAGPIVGTGFLFFTFMKMFFHGEAVWVEPNIVVLTFEIGLSALWFIGSFFDTVQTIMRMRKKG